LRRRYHSATAEESAASAEELNAQSDLMANVVKSYKLRTDTNWNELSESAQRPPMHLSVGY